MKKLFLAATALVVMMCGAFAQNNRGFSFQGIARDASGSIFNSAKIDLTMSLLDGTTVKYAEKQSTTTDAYGVFSVVIGTGTPEPGSGTFASVDYSKQLNIKIDVSIGGGAVTTIANYSLQAVPYAKQADEASHALNADNATNAAKAVNADNAAKADKADNATRATSSEKADNGVPAGTMLAWAGPESTIPAGYLACYGQAVSRTQYAALFNAIGTVWGAGDGSTTFNLPYTAGQFLRGADLTRGVDPDAGTRTAKYTGGATGGNTGSYQNDESCMRARCGAGGTRGLSWGSNYQIGWYTEPTTETIGGKETRPKNVNVEYIIKY